MVRTACHLFVLPTPLSRLREAIQTGKLSPSSWGAKSIMPFNNAAERALRGVAVGRANWTFAGSDRGAERAATIYTLTMTCKLNHVDPQACIADVLARLPDHPARRIDELMPWAWLRPALAQAA